MRSGKAECYGPLAIPPLSLLCVTPKRPTESLSATHLPDRARFVRDVFVCETESPSRFLKGGLCRLWLAARAENTRILTCRSWFPSSLHCHLVTEYLYFGHKTVSAHNMSTLGVAERPSSVSSRPGPIVPGAYVIELDGRTRILNFWLSSDQFDPQHTDMACTNHVALWIVVERPLDETERRDPAPAVK